MPIKNASIAQAVDDYINEKGKPDTDKQPVIDDIRDYCEAFTVNGISVGTRGAISSNYVPGVYIQGPAINLNGRAVALAAVPAFLANEDISDLISMRDALARVLQSALAELRIKKGSVIVP